ncbi:universal stress protein [Desulfosarcina widdelii]|uniref:Universal stress protein n=1 Tax=Desulfosarcina widdelii TaxID=947919 RepID=A0A5K7Z1J2_9BACT|nr:universal stress protein [Desulfosarcina widdelii]BBO74109.1 universal stress protein [Desulfosarcina widdelii]
MFNRILAATDIATTPDAPVVTAARLARGHHARLYLLHVMESASTENRKLIRHYETDAEMIADAAYEQTVAQVLRRTFRDSIPGEETEVRVTAGFPWEEILQYARQIDADLIVLGPHSTRAQEKGVVRIAGLVGSTVENVMIRETCPVMVVNRPANAEQLRFRRVLIPVDFSRSCECAVCFAARLAANCHSQLQIFHMIPVPPVPKYNRSAYNRDKASALKRLESLYRPYLDGIEHRYIIHAGSLPHLEILNAARDQNSDLIVMGSHTKETGGKWYPGSAVERVGFRASCPLVTITDPQVLIHWKGRLTDTVSKEPDRRIHVFTGTGSHPSPKKGGMS